MSRKILVVDDEALLAMELEYLLTDAGYTVFGPASTVPQAMEILEGDAPDMAILDLNLTRGRSDAIADRLSEIGVPFLYLTGYQVDNLPPAHRSRPLVSKPFREDTLLGEIERLLA